MYSSTQKQGNLLLSHTVECTLTLRSLCTPGNYSHIYSVSFPWELRLNPDPGTWRTPLHKRRAKTTAVPPFNCKCISDCIKVRVLHNFAKPICTNKSEHFLKIKCFSHLIYYSNKDRMHCIKFKIFKNTI